MENRYLRRSLFGAACGLALIFAGCDASDPGGSGALLGSDANDAAALAPAPAGEVIPGQYVIVLDATPTALTGGRLAGAARATLDELVRLPGVEEEHTYTSALVGFSARLTDAAVAALRADPRVEGGRA